MLYTNTQRTTCRAGLAGIGRVDELDLDAGSFRLVSDKRLQLCPGPAVQTGAHALPGLDPLPDVGQVLHGDRAAFISYRFRDNGLADFVVHMGDMAGFSARDFAEQLTCALRAVALKPPTKGKVFVAIVTEFPATKEFAGAHGGDGVFPEIDPQDSGAGTRGHIRQVQHQVEIEPSLALDQFSFLGDTGLQVPLLELSQFHRDDDPAGGGKQGYGVALEGVRPLVEVDGAGVSERNHRPNFFPEPRVVGHQRLVGLRHRRHGVAGHLRTKIGYGIPGGVVPLMVELHPVADTTVGGHTSQQVACLGKLGLQGNKQAVLIKRGRELYADSAFHSAPTFDVFGALDVPLNGFGTHIASSANVVGWRPQMAAPQRLLQFRKRHKKLAGCDAFQQLHGGSDRVRWWDRHKQMDVIRLNLQRDNLPPVLCADAPQYSLQHSGDTTGQDSFPVLRAPHHMVGSLVNAVPAINGSNHSHILISVVVNVKYKRFLPRLKSGVSA